MGRIEDLELEIERLDEKDRNDRSCPCDDTAAEQQQELLEELDSLQEKTYPGLSDTNELP